MKIKTLIITCLLSSFVWSLPLFAQAEIGIELKGLNLPPSFAQTEEGLPLPLPKMPQQISEEKIKKASANKITSRLWPFRPHSITDPVRYLPNLLEIR